MPNDQTAAVVAYLTDPAKAELLLEFFADVGGDPESYGFERDDVLTASQLGTALRTYPRARRRASTRPPQRSSPRQRSTGRTS